MPRFLARVKFIDARVEAFRSRLEVHGALECEDGERQGKTGAEVYDCICGECAACAVSED